MIWTIEHHYSPSTGETLLLRGDPKVDIPLKEQIRWFDEHPDSILRRRDYLRPMPAIEYTVRIES